MTEVVTKLQAVFIYKVTGKSSIKARAVGRRWFLLKAQNIKDLQIKAIFAEDVLNLWGF